MKRLLLLPVLFVANPSSHAESTPRQAIREKLPTYSAAEHDRAVAEQAAIEAARTASKAAAAADPDLVVLPDLTVEEKAIQRMEEDSLYRKGAYDKELVKQELTEFDQYFLNRYTIPIIGISKEARAREAYLERKNRVFQERMQRLASLVALQNKDEAREFRAVLRDASLDNRGAVKDEARSHRADTAASSRMSE